MPENLLEQTQFDRLRLRDVVFIGITGSCGKTTTKDLTTGLLRPDFKGISSTGNGNCGSRLLDTLLKVQPSHGFCIQELGAWGPGTLDAALTLLQPDIGAVLNVRNDHYGAFRGLQNTQAEKSKVVRSLPSTGTAVLNVDDPLVWAMRHSTGASILGFGLHENADLRAERVCGAWPDRLSFDLVFRNEIHHVTTQLVGTHLVGSALAALAIAVTMGVPLGAAVDRLGMLPPTTRRMSPVLLQSGITFVRDEFKATNELDG